MHKYFKVTWTERSSMHEFVRSRVFLVIADDPLEKLQSVFPDYDATVLPEEPNEVYMTRYEFEELTGDVIAMGAWTMVRSSSIP